MNRSSGSCHACGASDVALMKLSLGKDFFGRPYDRLSPSSDQSPQWYCEICSMHKNLQRDLRDIRVEFDKLAAGQASALATADEFRRASLRLREISAIVSGHPPSKLIDHGEVTLMIERLNTATMPT